MEELRDFALGGAAADVGRNGFAVLPVLALDLDEAAVRDE